MSDEHATIHQGETLSILPSLGKFDLCITDPPYSSGSRRKEWRSGGSVEAGLYEAAKHVEDKGMMIVFSATSGRSRNTQESAEHSGWDLSGFGLRQETGLQSGAPAGEVEMRKEYDFNYGKSRRNPYAKEFRMKLEPLYDRILVQRAPAEKKTAGGIHIPESSEEKPIIATVVAVGTGRVDEAGKIYPLRVKTG